MYLAVALEIYNNFIIFNITYKKYILKCNYIYL